MIQENPHALALITVASAITFASAALKVGDGVAPKSGDGKVVAPSTVLYMRNAGSYLGSLGCIDTDADMRFQFTSIGRTASEARAVADKVDAAIVGAEIPVAGRWVTQARRMFPASTVERDDSIVPPLFYVPVQYRLLTLQAS